MNPFKKDTYMLPVASINSVYVDGKKAYDLFRPALIIESIKNVKLFALKDLDNKQVFEQFDQLLQLNDPKAVSIATTYKKNFYQIIRTLVSPSVRSMKERKNWTQNHWDYWKSVRKIYFVGGLTIPVFSDILQKYVNEQLLLEEINLSIEFVVQSFHYGVKGLASISNENTLIFDFGQTNIKRGYLHDGLFEELESVPSRFLEYKKFSDKALRKSANQMNEHIVNTIINSIQETKHIDTIRISIANYIYNGKIHPARGAYGKLSVLHDNYQQYLTEQLSEKMKREIKVELYHDTTSMALNFSGQENCAVISLGTAFGVAFPE